MQSSRLLLVEDSCALAQLYMSYLDGEGYEIEHTASGNSAIRILGEIRPSVLLLDLNLPDISGIDVLDYIEREQIPTCVIVVTGSGSVDIAVEVMRKGAFDFIEKPVAAQRLIVTVRNALERSRLTRIVDTYEETLSRSRYEGFIGASPAMQAVYRIIDSAATSTASIFISGESGTGKELCAQAIHNRSTRDAQPFIPLNCTAISPELVESELFGHVKGSFTGAVNDRDGAALMADGGTMFLDEICEMRLDLQCKLLRLIQGGEVQKVGSSKISKVDIRFVCATNRSPYEEVRAGRFREDLLHRLHVIPIHLPPLRERSGDVLLLARKFLQEYAEQEGKAFECFDTDVGKALCAATWPGNVRELQNVIRRAVVLNTGRVITLEMIRAAMAENNFAIRPAAHNGGIAPVRARSLAQSEDLISAESIVLPLSITKERAIRQAIESCDGNIVQAAALLRVNPSTIYRSRRDWEQD